MSKLSRVSLVSVLALFIAAFSMPVVKAAESATTGSIKGKVVSEDGKPVANMRIRLFTAGKDAKDDAHQGAKGAAAIDFRAGKALKNGAKPAKKTAVQETTSNDKGEFTLENVDAGDYELNAGKKNEGHAHQKVTVKAGKVAEVTLTVKSKAAA